MSPISICASFTHIRIRYPVTKSAFGLPTDARENVYFFLIILFC